MHLPGDFRISYENFASYPRNLVHKGSYLPALDAYGLRLDNASSKLFTENDLDPNEIDVPFRDWVPAGQGTCSPPKFERQTVRSDEALKGHLGDQSTTTPNNPISTVHLATNKDPKCRFIFISSGKDGHSRRRLKVTRGMLLRTLSYHQVMPIYLDFISVFGQQSRPRDLRFSGFREQTLLSGPLKGPVIPDLGRSGRQFQLCYNLKSVSPPSSVDPMDAKKEWPIRQAAIHHQFDVLEGTTLWLITKGNLDLKDRIQDMTGKDGRPEDRAFGTSEECFKSSLAVHLMLCHWSTEEWRWYIQRLETVIEEETENALLGSREATHARQKYTPRHLMDVQYYEDKTNEAIMIMEANIDVLTALRRYYEGLLRHKDFPMKRKCREDVLTFAIQVNDLIYDSKMQISRAKLLVTITADRKSLVLQHLQSQTTEKMEALTRSMHKIGIDTKKETIAMRIITVVTLLYLPATFVSETFFSTDVVKYQNQNGSGNSSSGNQLSNGSFSNVALQRWLEVTLPLTLITIVGAVYFFKRAGDKVEGEEFQREDLELLPLYWTGHNKTA